MTWRKMLGITLASACAAASILFIGSPATAAPASQLVPGTMTSAAVGGAIDYTVYLPAGYDPSGATRYPTLYLLHGRGDTQAAWQQEAGALDELIAAKTAPPMIVIMPDAPWSTRGNYYVDSLYTGGTAVETAFTTDLVGHIDASYPTIDDRAARAVGGYSMGGAGALRYATVHQNLFSSAIVLSPAVYFPSTPVDSSTREFGAYGVGDALYDEARYQALNYPAAFAAFDPALPVHLFIAVGDDEYANPLPEDAIHDLDYEAATLYNQAKRVPGITAELRVYNGGHDWGVWDRGFREGLADISGYLQATPPAPFTGSQFGSVGDDRAGGVLARADGSVVQAINAADTMLGHTGEGGIDILLQKLAANGTQEWMTPIATPLNDRAYGVVDGAGGAIITAGFQRRDHAGAQNDDALVMKVADDGTELWRTTFGSSAAADRVYGVASDGLGGAFVTGYTSGVLPSGVSAGDKDAIVGHISADGTVDWASQFGGSGEDKGFAVTRAPDGGVFVGGTAGAGMPGAASIGGYDGWVAKFAADGSRQWITAVGTAEGDQVSALVETATGVAASGFTGGVLGTASRGGNDAFVTALGADGTVQWTTQEGSAGDDRAAAVTADAAGNLLVTGHTSGSIVASSGGVDIFTLTLTPAGAVTERSQFGSAARDGADEFDEANLYVAGGGSSTLVQALSYGHVDGAVNVGGGDVVLAKVGFAGVVDSAVTGSGGPGAGGPGSSWLASTGADVARAVLVGLMLLGIGAILMRRRRGVIVSRRLYR